MNDEAQMTNDEGMTNVERMRDDFEDAFWNHDVLAVTREETGEKRAYDLEERTPRFGQGTARNFLEYLEERKEWMTKVRR